MLNIGSNKQLNSTPSIQYIRTYVCTVTPLQFTYHDTGESSSSTIPLDDFLWNKLHFNTIFYIFTEVSTFYKRRPLL